MAEVEVIKAVEGPILRKRDYEGKPLVITRQRVASYGMQEKRTYIICF